MVTADNMIEKVHQTLSLAFNKIGRVRHTGEVWRKAGADVVMVNVTGRFDTPIPVRDQHGKPVYMNARGDNGHYERQPVMTREKRAELMFLLHDTDWSSDILAEALKL